MKELQNKIRTGLYDLLKDQFPIECAEIEFSIPPKREFGDISTTLPFVLAKKMKEKPFLIGKKIVELLDGCFDFVEVIKLANGGFINFYLNKTYFLTHVYQNRNQEIEATGKKVIVEHTSINPNKSAHIGHLRNSCLGDSLISALKYCGNSVEIQNYLDDTGIQVADVVWGVLYHEKKSLEEIKDIEDIASYLWNLYTEVHKLPEEESIEAGKKAVHQKIEDKINPEYEMSDYISKSVTKNHIDVMNRLGIRYDLLIRESDIIELDFFTEAAELLKKTGIMYLSEDPAKENCWVIKYRKENIEKIIIRSNGTITYIGKDIAYTLWKTGYFKKDFYYKPFYSYPDSKAIYISDDRESDLPKNTQASYGSADMVYNVIDTRQAYLQNLIAQILSDLSDKTEVRNFSHFSYEMVALTQNCVNEMGFEISDDQKQKSYIEVSGRKGIAIKADELIDRLKQKSLVEVEKRNQGADPEEIDHIAEEIAIGALRYFMIKYNSNSVIAFDFDEVLSFEGDTGPYLQYTLVRINSILKKLDRSDQDVSIESKDLEILGKDELSDYYNHLIQLSLLQNQVEFALESDEISLIPNYAYAICQKLNNYYHKYPILSEKNPEIKSLRIALLVMTKNRLETLYSIMGIPVPAKM